jgi:hypothetical protein
MESTTSIAIEDAEKADHEAALIPCRSTVPDACARGQCAEHEHKSCENRAGNR